MSYFSHSSHQTATEFLTTYKKLYTNAGFNYVETKQDGAKGQRIWASGEIRFLKDYEMGVFKTALQAVEAIVGKKLSEIANSSWKEFTVTDKEGDNGVLG